VDNWRRKRAAISGTLIDEFTGRAGTHRRFSRVSIAATTEPSSGTSMAVSTAPETHSSQQMESRERLGKPSANSATSHIPSTRLAN
jgi:hypothetical protein